MTPLELTRELTRIRTVNPPGDERACAELLGGILERAGLQVDYYEYAERRTSLVARLDSPSNEAPLCFTGHIDTVPLGMAQWSCDPFAADTDGGKLFGRGTTDMKAGVAAFVCAAMELARSPRPRAGLVLVITAGEELGCEGAVHLAKQGSALGRAGAIVIGEPTGNYPCIGHKGALALNVVTRGVTAHASTPELGSTRSTPRPGHWAGLKPSTSPIRPIPSWGDRPSTSAPSRAG